MDHTEGFFVFGLAEAIPERGVCEAPEVHLILGLSVPILSLFFEGEVVVIIQQILIKLTGL